MERKIEEQNTEQKEILYGGKRNLEGTAGKEDAGWIKGYGMNSAGLFGY